jgi:transposase
MQNIANELRVCMDIGCTKHRVGIGLSNGKLLEKFDLFHTPEGIEEFFKKINRYEKDYKLPVAIAMEAYNGYARPIDQLSLEKGYRVLNINNNKLAQFKKVFAGPAKTDDIDVEKMFELFTLSDHLPLSKHALQPVSKPPVENEQLKRITRRRQFLVEEKIRIINRMQSDIQAVIPGLLEITGAADNQWFLNFLTAREDIRQLGRITTKSILKIKGIGQQYALAIQKWQKTAIFSGEVQWVGNMIIRDAKRILELIKEIKELEKHIEEIIPISEMACRLQTITGFGTICASTLAGEIGTLERFNSEASLALYLGMAVLDNSSGNYEGTKKAQHVCNRGKRAMMTAVARHIDYVAEAKKYYNKKRMEGKKHNQAIRALGRHMVRVIWSMLKNKRDYESYPINKMEFPLLK